jgi:small-conductance mechanosensitive channel
MLLDDIKEAFVHYGGHLIDIVPKLALAIVLLIIAIFLANYISNLIGGRLKARSHDPLLAEFLTRMTKWAVILLGLTLVLQVLGMTGLVGGMVAGAGLTAFVVGFALKDIAENFLAGVVLAFNRPFRIHDTIQIRDNQALMGRVEALNLRTTLIKTFDGKHIFLPNAMVLREPLTNFTRDGYIRQDFQLTVNVEQDGGPERLQGTVLDFVRGYREVVHEEPHSPYLILEKLDGNTATLHLYFWTFSEDYRRGTQELKSDLMRDLRQLLLQQGYPAPAAVQ